MINDRETLQEAADIESALTKLETAADFLDGQPNKIQLEDEDEDDEDDDFDEEDAEFDFGDEVFDLSESPFADVPLSDRTKELLAKCINSRIDDLKNALHNLGILDTTPKNNI